MQLPRFSRLPSRCRFLAMVRPYRRRSARRTYRVTVGAQTLIEVCRRPAVKVFRYVFVRQAFHAAVDEPEVSIVARIRLFVLWAHARTNSTRSAPSSRSTALSLSSDVFVVWQ
jgi:hypothetical protein